MGFISGKMYRKYSKNQLKISNITILVEADNHEKRLKV